MYGANTSVHLTSADPEVTLTPGESGVDQATGEHFQNKMLTLRPGFRSRLTPVRNDFRCKAVLYEGQTIVNRDEMDFEVVKID